MKNELVVAMRSGGSKFRWIPIEGVIPEVGGLDAPVVVQQEDVYFYGAVETINYRQWDGKLWEPVLGIGVMGNTPPALLPSGRLTEAMGKSEDAVRLEDLPPNMADHVADAVARLLMVDGVAHIASMGPLLRTYESQDGPRGALQYPKASPVNWVSSHPYHAFFRSEDYDALCRAGRPDRIPGIRVLDLDYPKVDETTYRACVVEAAAWMALAEFSKDTVETMPRAAVESMISIKRVITENWGDHVFNPYGMRNAWPHQGRVNGFVPPERLIEPLRDLTQHMSWTRSFPALVRSVIARYDRSRPGPEMDPLDAAALNDWNAGGRP